MSHATPVRLYGELGHKFGRAHTYHLDTKTPAEALRALFSQVEGAREYFMDAKAKGIEFAIFVGKRNLAAEHLGLPANDEIRIAPVPAGRKRGGIVSVIAGAVIIVASLVLDAWTDGGFSSATGGYTYTLGWAMIAGGIVQLLTPMPHGNSAKDKPENQPNYHFNGAINTQAQGNPVPLCYGRVKVGSAVISAGIDTLDTSFVRSRPVNPKLGFGGGGGWSGFGDPTIDLDPSP